MLEGFFVDAASSFMKETTPKENGFEDNEDPNGEMPPTKEGFSRMYSPVMGSQDDLAGMIGRVLALLFVLLLISFFGQYFWNTYVTSLFTFAKPAKSIMQILGLFVFVRLMFP